MPLPAANYIGWCLLDALGYLHGGIGASPAVALVHRDVNPSNVLLSVTGDVKLTDFGIAEFDGFPRAEQGALQGTVAYMSPEQVVGDAVERAERPVLGGRHPLGAGGERASLPARDRAGPARSGLATRRFRCSSRCAPECPSTSPGWCVRRRSRTGRSAFQSAGDFARALQLVAQRGWRPHLEALNPLLGRERTKHRKVSDAS